MPKVKKVPLGEVAEINPRSGRLAENETVSFVRMADVDEIQARVFQSEPRPAGKCSKGYTAFLENDILVAKITPCFENGKVAIASIPTPKGFGSTEFHVVRPKDKLIDNHYLLHLLRTPFFRLKGIRRMTGSAGQKRVPPLFLSTFDIPLPTFIEQKRIAAILDAADALRAKRRESIAQFDALVQSTFLEMFGDPVSNPMGWEMEFIGDLLVSTNYGTSKKADPERGSYPVLRMNNITYGGEWNLSDLKFIDLEEKELSNYLVREGEILFNRTNSKELVGKTAVFREKEPMAFAGYLIRGVVNDGCADPEYIAAFMNTPQMKHYLQAKCKSIVGMANINAKEFQAIPIPKPPVKLQHRFATIVQSIETQKSRLRAHLAELDTLFASLQSRAFNGEL